MKPLALAVAVLTAIGSAEVSAQSSRRKQTTGTGSIAGRVIHADGAAAEGARVAVYAVREGAPAAVVATTTSAHDGRYEVSGLSEGQFAVGVTPQRVRGFGGDSRRATSTAETLYPGVADRLKAIPIAVFEGLPTEGIDIWLAPAPQRYSISGKVSWPENVTVENIVIEFGGQEDVHDGVWYVKDPGGLFTIEGASPGTYLLLARGETANGPLLGLVATDVSDDVHDVRILLRTPGTVEGRIVIDGSSGPDVASLRVAPTQMLLTLSPLYPASEAPVDSAGHFALTQLAGQYTLDVRGLPPGWRVRRVTRGGTPLPDNRIVVPPGSRITGVQVVVGN